VKEELRAGMWIVLGDDGHGWASEHVGLVARIKSIGPNSGATGSVGGDQYDVVLDSASCPPLKGKQVAGEAYFLGFNGGFSGCMRPATQEEIDKHCKRYGIWQVVQVANSIYDVELSAFNEPPLMVGDRAIIISNGDFKNVANASLVCHHFNIDGEVEIIEEERYGSLLCVGTDHDGEHGQIGSPIKQFVSKESLRRSYNVNAGAEKYLKNLEKHLFKISYVAKDGSNKSVAVAAASEDDAISQIEDFSELNFTIKEE
jgi:hypothetical protein